MIDSDSVGQRKLDEIHKSGAGTDWSEYEAKFLDDNAGKTYSQMTNRQKNLVGQLWDKLKGF